MVDMCYGLHTMLALLMHLSSSRSSFDVPWRFLIIGCFWIPFPWHVNWWSLVVSFSLFLITQKQLRLSYEKILTLHMFAYRDKPFFSVTGCPWWVLQSWSGWISPQSHGRCEHIISDTSIVDLWSEVNFVQPCQKIFQFIRFDEG